MAALTFEELSKDIKKQLSNCPCDDCKFRMDYDFPNPIGRNNEGEVLYPSVCPMSFVCTWKGVVLDTDIMNNKKCIQKL